MAMARQIAHGFGDEATWPVASKHDLGIGYRLSEKIVLKQQEIDEAGFNSVGACFPAVIGAGS
jgi:hypothetical protein